MNARPRIVVAGAGFAGLETAYLVRMRLGDDADIHVVAPDSTFVFRPNSIYLPFGGDASALTVDLAKPFGRRGITHHRTAVTAVDTATRHISTTSGESIRYDHLVIATGADTNAREIPGLDEHAASIWTVAQMQELGTRLRAVEEAAVAGRRSRVLLAVAPRNKCSGPLYEIVFMLDTWLRRLEVRHNVDIVFRTYEASFIQAFGPRLHDVVIDEFARRGIDGATGHALTSVARGEALFTENRAELFDLMIAFPPYVAKVRYDGLPADDRGFITTDLASRAVTGVEDVYAPGDAGDFPVKQAFLAFLQADAAAEAIAARVRGDGEPRTTFDPVSMCVMEMLDRAAFAQVPLRVTGDPDHPVEVRPGAGDDYKVGVSPAWRLGKKMLGMYLPMRFGAGEPFHAGMGWQMMELGLRGMSGMLAH